MPRQPSYRELFRVGDVVEVVQAPLDGESKPQWLLGKVIQISTRLHVSHGGPGHMAYDRAAYNKGLIRKVSGSAQPMRAMPRKPTSRQLAAWREARIAHYTDTRSAQALAGMVVELEDEHDCVPEFEIDEEWPESVRSFKKGGG